MKHSLYYWFKRHHTPVFTNDWRDTDFLVIDLELTSLDVNTAELVSIAWVPIKQQRIQVNQAEYFIHKLSDCDLQQSPTIHGLTPAALSKGESLGLILQRLLSAIDKHVLIFHHAALDLPVLKRCCLQLKQPWPSNHVVIDTLKLDYYLLHKQQHPICHDSLTLAACRKRHNLPASQTHNALDDALATAELFLSQANGLSAGHPFTIQDLRRLC